MLHWLLILIKSSLLDHRELIVRDSRWSVYLNDYTAVLISASWVICPRTKEDRGKRDGLCLEVSRTDSRVYRTNHRAKGILEKSAACVKAQRH